ncbi:PREDICTED: ATP-dependent 6-phosphofructokinase 4, chloroplastic isoform X2 [Lupinus angustifolius]|uniref:ATP-dependent 6-phosphofructokinase 4, chloroplastic isoform X2 n=1 Tax=Lupinus angustifolius TaxID=3871 RepID=UPI00092E7D58|nr:PREDICTED: ATP-dependent 6-phosphofructokinase 4, chloroplastic isoform X2 [Lupinus angustifolius]
MDLSLSSLTFSSSSSSLSKTLPPFSFSPFSRLLFLHPQPSPLLSFSRQNSRAITASQASNQSKNDDFVLEDVPHLTNFLPNFPSFPNPLQKSQAYSIVKKTFVSPEDVVTQIIVIQKDSPRGVHFRRAGPREKVYFKPEEVRACIVTCGGLCPGINTVIREIVCGLNYMYGVEDILGIEGGYRGFYSKNTMKLTPKVVNDIHKRGGTFLRTSRGGHDTHKIVDNIEDRGINQVYIIGGDGTQKGAQLIYEEIAKRGLPVAVAGIPKTIDNDIAVIDKSFGFDTAVEEAQRAINAAHVEVESVENGVGIVKLMGRYSGFIAMYATLASRDVDCCLIPESPFYLEGEGGLFEFIEQRLKENGHLVIVVAEGAGQEYVAADVHAAGKKDASGNKLLLDNGIWLSDKIKDHFTKVQKMVINMKYIDPTYMIRAIPSNASDNIYCTLLAHSAVHGAMAGYTGFTVGPVNSRHAYIPIARVTERTNTVKLTDRMWGRLLASTNQPSFISSDKEIIQDLSNINITST